MIKLKENDNLILFQNLNEKLDKLYKWELITKAFKSKVENNKETLNAFKYYYIGNKKDYVICDVVGYIPYSNGNGDTAVVSVKSSLCKIMPAYLKQMQRSNFEIEVIEVIE